jgi:hypothetical protein
MCQGCFLSSSSIESEPLVFARETLYLHVSFRGYQALCHVHCVPETGQSRSIS